MAAEVSSVDDARLVTVGGLRLRVLARNLAAPRPPLLILGGLGQSIEVLLPLVAEFRDRPIVAYDVPGAGRSEAPRAPISIVRHAALAAGLARALDLARYDVLGISWGGAVAQQLAHDDPAGCRRLILAVTSAGGAGSWWGSPIALSEIVLPLRHVSRSYANLVGPLMYGGEAIADPALFREYSRWGLRPTLRGYYGQVAALCAWTSLPWLHRLDQPVQVIAGLFDALIPVANQLFLAGLLPSCELRVFPAGHLVMYSRRREVAALVTDFLDRDLGEQGRASEVKG